MNYFWAFCVGGAICVAGQLLIDLTGLTPARILTGYVVAGVVLSAIGWYAPLAEFAGCGATVPLLGFGHLLAKGVRTALQEEGAVGILTGGLTAAAAGVTTSLCAAWCAAGWAKVTTRTEEEIHQNIVTLSATLRPVFPPHCGKLCKTGGDADEAPLDDPFVGALGCTGLVRGGSPAAGQCVPYMPGTGAAGAGTCGGGAHGMGCVGAAGRAARWPAAGAASGAGTGVRFCHPVRF